MVLCQSHCQQGWCNRCFVWFNVLFSTFSHAFYTSLWLVSSQMKRRVLVWKRLRQWSRWGFVACFVTMPRWDSGVTGVLWHVLEPWQDDRTCQIWCTACFFCHLHMVCHHMRTKHAQTLAMVTLFLLGGVVGGRGEDGAGCFTAEAYSIICT